MAVGIGSTFAANARAAEPQNRSQAAQLSEQPPPDGNHQQENSWRYRRHGGLWWYWLPSEKWVYWTGDRWTSYDRASYARLARRVGRAVLPIRPIKAIGDRFDITASASRSILTHNVSRACGSWDRCPRWEEFVPCPVGAVNDKLGNASPFGRGG